MPFGGLIEHFFISLSSISLYARNTICLSIHLFKDILFCFHVLTIINKTAINICVGFCVDRSFQVNCVNIWVWLLDCMLRKSESEVAQSCLTLCNPTNCSLPGSSVRGIFQARVLEWVAISFSRGSSQPRDQTQVSLIVGRCFTVWATGK